MYQFQPIQILESDFHFSKFKVLKPDDIPFLKILFVLIHASFVKKVVLLDSIRHDDLLAMSIYITHQSEFTLKALGCEQLLNESGQQSL